VPRRNTFVIMFSLYTMSKKITFKFVRLVPARNRKIRPIGFGSGILTSNAGVFPRDPL